MVSAVPAPPKRAEKPVRLRAQPVCQRQSSSAARAQVDDALAVVVEGKPVRASQCWVLQRLCRFIVEQQFRLVGSTVDEHIETSATAQVELQAAR